MPSLDVARRRLLFAIFVVSGFTGLIYESIWTQYLKLFLGHAAYAQSLVLAIFMGGMALGSWLVARYCSRMRQLLWAYLLVEALIGVLGMLFHRVFVSVTEISLTQVIPALTSAFAINAYKWSLAALLVLPQSVLLGMTFPLISGGIIRRWPERPGETLSILYFTNSLGGALGVLVSGFVLIAAVGLPGTILTAGLLNMALALGVWLMVRRQSEPPALAPAGSASPLPSSTIDAAGRWFVLAAGVMGAASFMYELGWIRMLGLVLGSSTHSFELMLSAFIFGLAFGGLHARKRIDQLAEPEVYLGWIMLAIGALAALTVPAGNLMFNFMAWALATFTRTSDGYVAFNIVSQSIAMLIMFPAAYLSGMALPLLTRALMRRGAGEKAIGTIYSVNTLGAIAGVLLAVHVLMPLIGVKGVILTGAALHITLGLSRLAPGRWRQPAAVVAMAVCLAVFGLTAGLAKLDPRRVASGVYRSGTATAPPKYRIIYLRDGKTSTVTLAQAPGWITIATNGKPDASVAMQPGAEPTSDEPTQVLVAAIPLSLHPQARRVANIGFGSGVSSHVLLGSERLERLDTIEIEPLMVEAAHQGFGARTHNVFEDPRSHIVYEDAKTFFAATHEPYDLIVSEPSNPWVSGVATLFSDEFYARIGHYLRPDGYFAQWIQVYETNVDIVASVIKGVSRNFGTYQIYNLNDEDLLIVAARAGVIPAPSEQVFQWPQLRAELDRIGVQSVADMHSRLIGDGRIMDPLFDSIPVPVNSDFFPFVDLNAPRLRFLREDALDLLKLTFLPAPYLELLRSDVPGGPTLEPSARSRQVRDELVRRALTVRSALSTGKLDATDAGVVTQLLLINTSAEKCADPAVQNTWKRAVRSISDMTATYLSPTDLAGVWQTIRATPCYRNSNGPQRTWADFLAAVATRDAAEIVTLGSHLLQDSPALSRDDRTYLTTLTATAYMQLGNREQARGLLGTQWSQLDLGGEFGFALRSLSALAREGASGAAHR
jgi:predicted membrane-bound spermidine synthase